MTILHVALGGALGAALRYLCSISFAFPFATLFVNVLGSFLMGLAFVWLSSKGLDRWQPLVMTGFMGGFTTYSAFSLDVLKLVQSGQAGGAFLYMAGTVLLCVGAVFAGVAMARGIAL